MAAPLRLFVCEYVTGGGCLGEPLPPSLAREGDLMLRRLAQDLIALHGMQVTVGRDPRLTPLALPVRTVVPADAASLWACWRRCISEADAVWPIAPETDGLLERLSALALEAGRALLGSRPEALRVAASKRATVELLHSHGFPAVPTWPADRAPPHAAFGWVVKPDDGAGALDTLRFEHADALDRWLDGRPDRERFVVQPFVPGPALSLSLLCRDGQAWLLACNRQVVTVEAGRFRYRGSIVAGAEDRRSALEPIARGVAAVLPGLFGHVGVDLVAGPDGPCLLEVNPRLTTSYAGLGEAIGVNPAALALELHGRDLAALRRPLAPRAVPVLLDVIDA